MSSITEEKKFGISSCLSVQCNVCSKINNISTSEQHRSGQRGPKAYDANTRVALAAIDNGLGFKHVNSILTALDIPSMTRKTYKIREHEVGKIAEWVAKDSCKEMLDQECTLAKKKMELLSGAMDSYHCLCHLTWGGPSVVVHTTL